MISIVVCTRNRVEQLPRCVAALHKIQTDKNWELVIVDNGSSDGTADYLASLPATIGNATVITTSEPKAGLSRARNKGISTATGDVLAFTDDDCYVAEDYIDRLTEAFSFKDIHVVGGRILLFDETDLWLTVQTCNDPISLRPRSYIATGVVQGCNMAFRRTALETIGGFAEYFGNGTPFPCEDIDAVAAVLWSGLAGIYRPEILVYHHHGRRTLADAKAIQRSYAWGRGAYAAKYILRKDTRKAYLLAFSVTMFRYATESFGGLMKGRKPSIIPIIELIAALRFAKDVHVGTDEIITATAPA